MKKKNRVKTLRLKVQDDKVATKQNVKKLAKFLKRLMCE